MDRQEAIEKLSTIGHISVSYALVDAIQGKSEVDDGND